GGLARVSGGKRRRLIDGSAAAREQRVGDVIGLAEAERHRQLDGLADARDDRVGHSIRVFERDWLSLTHNHATDSVCSPPLVGRGWGWGSQCEAPLAP